jgi:hypothetical protein
MRALLMNFKIALEGQQFPGSSRVFVMLENGSCMAGISVIDGVYRR